MAMEVSPSGDGHPPVAVRPVSIGPMRLPGELRLPPDPAMLVIFVHGSGSSRLSPRNRHVAGLLNEAGLATLLFDLLSPEEARQRALVFNIPLLASRLGEAIAFARQEPALAALPLGLFGASTGAAAALVAAAGSPQAIGAIVSRGGRPDLAAEALPRVEAPVLLIVGGADTDVLALNRLAQKRLACPNKLVVVAGATHLFEEAGALDHVARLAAEWFVSCAKD